MCKYTKQKQFIILPIYMFHIHIQDGCSPLNPCSVLYIHLYSVKNMMVIRMIALYSLDIQSMLIELHSSKGYGEREKKEQQPSLNLGPILHRRSSFSHDPANPSRESAFPIVLKYGQVPCRPILSELLSSYSRRYTSTPAHTLIGLDMR